MFINLQGGRKVSGTLRGFDIFLNLVLDDAVEETTPAQKDRIGNVVRIVLVLAHCILLTFVNLTGHSRQQCNIYGNPGSTSVIDGSEGTAASMSS